MWNDFCFLFRCLLKRFEVSTTSAIPLFFSTVTAFVSKWDARTWLPTLRMQLCLHIPPMFWIITRVASSVSDINPDLLLSSMKLQFVLKFTWTHFSQNDVFYSFNYCNLFLWFIQFKLHLSMFWNALTTIYWERRIFTGFLFTVHCCGTVTPVLTFLLSLALFYPFNVLPFSIACRFNDWRCLCYVKSISYQILEIDS